MNDAQTPAEQVVIHVVDDDEAMRVALMRLLAAAGYAPRGYASAGEFLIAADDAATGCLLLDLHMPGPDGLALYEALRRKGCDLPTVFLTGRGDIASSVRAMKAGASDFLTKPVPGDTLLSAVRTALDDDRPRRAQRDRERALAQRIALLDERESRVLRRVLEGALTKQIAYELAVSERTVKACRAAVMRKMGASTLPELVRLAQGQADRPPAAPAR
jgi:FixJ family two-component response regulator